MGRKSEFAHNQRKKFIEQTVNELRKSTQFQSIREIYQYIADELLFCDITTVERALKPYAYNEKQTSLFQPNSTQLKFNLK